MVDEGLKERKAAKVNHLRFLRFDIPADWPSFGGGEEMKEKREKRETKSGEGRV